MSEEWRGDGIICTQYKQQKACASSENQQVGIGVFHTLWCFKLCAPLILLYLLFFRDFLHPNLIQYSHDTTNHTSSHSTSFKQHVSHHVSSLFWFIRLSQHQPLPRIYFFLFPGTLLLPWRSGGIWGFSGGSQHMFWPKVRKSVPVISSSLNQSHHFTIVRCRITVMPEVIILTDKYRPNLWHKSQWCWFKL